MSASRMLVAGVMATLAVFSQTLPETAVGILTRNCNGCHSGSVQMSDLQLTSREAILKGGKRGPAIVTGDAANSRLYQFVSRAAQPNMPPGKLLPPQDIASIRKWIDGGAIWPAAPKSASSVPAKSDWWAFRKPVRPPVPAINDPWVRNPIDAFVLAKLREEKMKPSREATRPELIRRAYLDLTGLPPPAEDVKRFSESSAPDAYEKLVDKLLASPQYGVKWARKWLDLVRYADTAGYELDPYIADAWRYRDWVVGSLNQDKPYDLFVKEQIAADELFPKDPVARTGTGYYCLGPNLDIYPDQQDVNRVQTMTDYVDTTGAVFLGVTVGCARCHDHKFDPIPQRDYYRLQAIFEPAVKTQVALGKLPGLSYRGSENSREIKLQEIADEISSVESECRQKMRQEKKQPTDPELRACLSPADAEKLKVIGRQLVAMFANYKPKPFVCGVTEMTRVYPETHIPARGGGDGPAVVPGFLSALGGRDIPEPPTTATTTGRRRALAEWIANPENPLTARVMVNRIWQGHFNRGIEATPSDFGVRGMKPSHPELLDWLATEFVAKDWSMKQMHRLMMTSSTYRQSSDLDAVTVQRDPENIYLSHMSRRRLGAEEVRDSILQASGTLNLKMDGRPVVPALTEKELYGLTGTSAEKWIVTRDPAESNRRSIYLFVRRTYRIPMLEVFDAPESVQTCPRRESSTTSTQSLTLLNSDFAVHKARELAAALVKAHAEDEPLVNALWNSALDRDPTAQESKQALDFLTRQKENTGKREAAAAELARALFNLNEFLYVD